MITCRDVILDLLYDYLDQALRADLIRELEEHLRICAPCRAYLETYRKTRALAGRAAVGEMPAEMKDRLREFLIRRLPQPSP